MAKTITLKQVGFKFEGTALLNLWGGGQGTMKMDSWEGTSDKRKEVAKGVNDGQFGCESIESAQVDVYEMYEHGHTEYKDTISFSKKELQKAQRGI